MGLKSGNGHGEKWTRKKDAAILALLSEPTVAAAAKKAGVSQSTLKRWQQIPSFQVELENARREVLQVAVNNLQSSMQASVDTLANIAKNAQKESDRIRAAVSVLTFGFRGLELTDALRPRERQESNEIDAVSRVVECLAGQLQRVFVSPLNTEERTRLISQLCKDIVHVTNAEILQQRIDALEATLIKRQEAQS